MNALPSLLKAISLRAKNSLLRDAAYGDAPLGWACKPVDFH